MAFDESRYRREVLDAGLPVTEDLRTRYQLPQNLDGTAVAETVTAVRACWRRSRARLKYRAVIEQLEAGYLSHRPLLDAVAAGDPGPLRAALAAHGRRAQSERARLRAALEEATGGLGMLAESTVVRIAAAHRVREDEVRELLPALGLRIAEPEPLPRSVPHPAYARCAGHLEVLGLRHLGDFLATGTPGGRSEQPVHVFDALPADPPSVEAAARRWARLPHGAAHTAAQAVIAAVRGVLTEQGPEGVARILLYELAMPLRTRCAARATPATLLAYAVGELSVAEDDARRLVFAVLHEAAGDPVSERLRRLVADGRLAEAAAVADRLPPGSLAEDVRALAEHVHGKLAEARAMLDRARRLSPAEADRAWDLLEQAEAAVRDLPGTDAVRRGLAVHPVSGLTATRDGAGVTVRWRPSPSTAGEPEYVLLRTERRPPRDAADGTVLALASPRATSYVDGAPPACVPLYYAVAVRRAAEPGSAPSPLMVSGPLVHWPEVTDARLRPADRQISADWTCPDRARSVEVVRTAPDGEEVHVAARRDGFTDGGLANGTTYGYRIRVVYRTDDGTTVRTAGIRRTARPLAPPEPVTGLDIRLVDGCLSARLDPLPDGEVRLYGFDDLPPWPVGTWLRTAELPGRPIAAQPAPEGLRFAPPGRPTLVVAVTVVGERAVIGAHAATAPPALGTPTLTRHGGTGVTVVFDWPPDSGDEAEVTWRTPGEAGGQRRTVTRSAYRHEAGVRLPVVDGAGVEVEVRPITELGGLPVYGPPSTAVLPPRADAGYRLERRGLPGRRTVTAVFTAHTVVRAERLLLVRSPGPVWPLEPADGDVLAETADVTLGPGNDVRLSARLGRGPSGWLRCFAVGESLVLRDPPQHTLKVT
ncbi:hypothetical protein [Streptomyces roseochromogenus]|uniref:Fibronectin type-III domain-containing protein n=1 Tax=Streptomyces roseochromogenus subsp. oscitans DS 12.976 TaxID=1352936 RepID=V6KWG3_STRRC|nr:hypothetical protein [Streptomyces roseochromogenus]EST36510.1 hypothetical protein M878_01100 [Streptomyces roseochromogenus subsp. oscitans DS 12.976]